jgi:MFS family permease
VFSAIVFWGFQMAMTQGMASVLVTDTVGEKLRGTAFGVLYVLTGIVYLIASPLYGWVWKMYGGAWPFIVSAIISALSMILLYSLSFKVKS